MKTFTADWLCPASGPPVRNGALVVERDRIVRAGPPPQESGPEVTAYPGCAIIPGLVNVHAHLELTILRGFLENLPFREWISRLTRTKYDVLSREDLRVSAQLGAIEMLKAGVTAVGEVMDVGTGWEAMREFGLQGVAFQEVFGPAESAADKALQDLMAKLDVLRAGQAETRRAGVSPHAPYTVSGPLFAAVRDYARKEGLPLTTHVGESAEETLFVRDGTGPFEEGLRHRGIPVLPQNCLPLAYLDRLGLLGSDMLLVHAIEVDDQDLRRIAETRSKVAHCPKSNAKLGHGTAPVAALRRGAVTVGLGTDSVASNNVVDMFEEMRSAVFQQRTLARKPDALTASDAFQMATLDGARCLGLDHLLGSLDPGKRADFVVVDLNSASTQPVYDPIETMVYSASRANVKATFVGGAEVSLDDTEILRAAGRIADRLRCRGGL